MSCGHRPECHLKGWEFGKDGYSELKLGIREIAAKDRSRSMKILRDYYANNATIELLASPSLGRSMECIAMDKANSHFLFSGKYTKFADWHFIHRACTEWLQKVDNGS